MVGGPPNSQRFYRTDLSCGAIDVKITHTVGLRQDGPKLGRICPIKYVNRTRV